VQTVTRSRAYSPSPREVIGSKLSGRRGPVARGSKAEGVLAMFPGRRSSRVRKTAGADTGVAFCALRGVAYESKPSPRSTLARVLHQLRRAARSRRFERTTERLALLRPPNSVASKAWPPHSVRSLLTVGVVRSTRVPGVQERRSMASESSSWRSLHEVVGAVLAGMPFDPATRCGRDAEPVRTADEIEGDRIRRHVRTSAELASMPRAETSVLAGTTWIGHA
jgi:hypothetical protein